MPDRKTITLGGIKKIEIARKRKENQKPNKMRGNLGILTSRKQDKRGPPLPTLSVCFIENTANGEVK